MSKVKQLSGLGKGLGALISPSGAQVLDNSKMEELPADTDIVGVTAKIEIKKITTNPLQPRKDFDEEALEDLKKSIHEKGVIQPITVRRKGSGFELISGERRFRASSALGLEYIPAYIMNVETDREMLEIALIENVQRENLNPIEVALGFDLLIKECNLTQEQVAKKVGKNRSTVTNILRLLDLPNEAKEALRKDKLTIGHARTLLTVPVHLQLQALDKIISEELNVRQTERLQKWLAAGNPIDGFSLDPQPEADTKPEPKPVEVPEPNPVQPTEEPVEAPAGNTEKPSDKPDDPNQRAMEEQLQRLFGTRVRIAHKSNDAGSIVINYTSDDERERLIELLLSLKEIEYKL